LTKVWLVKLELKSARLCVPSKIFFSALYLTRWVHPRVALLLVCGDNSCAALGETADDALKCFMMLALHT